MGDEDFAGAAIAQW